MSIKYKRREGYPDAELKRMAFIANIAYDSGWNHLDTQKNIGMISFTKKNARINVYCTKMTVTTIIDHPTKGRGQLFRKNVSVETLKEIFSNPRIHTGIGYYNK